MYDVNYYSKKGRSIKVKRVATLWTISLIKIVGEWKKNWRIKIPIPHLS